MAFKPVMKPSGSEPEKPPNESVVRLLTMLPQDPLVACPWIANGVATPWPAALLVPTEMKLLPLLRNAEKNNCGIGGGVAAAAGAATAANTIGAAHAAPISARRDGLAGESSA